MNKSIKDARDIVSNIEDSVRGFEEETRKKIEECLAISQYPEVKNYWFDPDFQDAYEKLSENAKKTVRLLIDISKAFREYTENTHIWERGGKKTKKFHF